VKFKSSKFLSVGVELEVQIVDRASFELVPASELIFERVASPLIHKEFLRSMLEFVSNPHDDPDSAVDEIREIARKVVELGRGEGFLLSAGGTHPFAEPENVKITQDSRYRRLFEEFKEVLRNFLIYGLHIHIGFPEADTALNAYNMFVKYSPLLLALSASSPFFRGRNTGILSYRSKLFEQLPRAGMPQQFSSYQEFVELVERLKETGTIESLRDIWWDVRLRPDLGTVEVRVCDSNPDFERLKGIAHLAVMIGSLSLVERATKDFHQIHLQNRWNAARHGLNATFITESGKSSVGRELLRLVARHGRFFGRMRSGAVLLENLTTKPTVAEVQIETFRRSGRLRETVEPILIRGTR